LIYIIFINQISQKQGYNN